MFYKIFEQNVNELSDDEHKHIMQQDWIPESIISWLKSKGLKLLGKGVFSAVYGRPGENKVVKINKEFDPAYKKFIDFAKDNPSKYFPKIYDTKELSNGMYLYIIESLESIPDFKNYIRMNLDKHLDMLMGLELMDKRTWEEMHIGSLMRHYLQTNFQIETGLDPFDEYEKFNKYRNEQLQNIGSKFLATKDGKLMQQMRKLGLRDLHPGNIMMRPSTKDIVFTDPVISPLDALKMAKKDLEK